MKRAGRQLGTERARITVNAAGRVALGRHGKVRGRPSWDSNAPPPSVHNVTPEEDYRTALLSDSPDAGVRYRTHGGEETAKRPGRQAGPRYSAGRAPGGRGLFHPLCIGGDHRSVARRRRSAYEGLAAFRPTVPRQELRCNRTSIGSGSPGPTVGWERKTVKQQQTKQPQSGQMFVGQAGRSALKS
jgi:hypothetical protein